MKKIIFIIVLLFFNNTYWWYFNYPDNDTFKTCPTKYYIENNKLMYQYFDIYAESWFCWTWFTHCRVEDKGYWLFKTDDFTITVNWIYNIKYSYNFYSLVKSRKIEFNYFYLIFILLIWYCLYKTKEKKTEK